MGFLIELSVTGSPEEYEKVIETFTIFPMDRRRRSGGAPEKVFYLQWILFNELGRETTDSNLQELFDLL
jgi:hypothetical protein